MDLSSLLSLSTAARLIERVFPKFPAWAVTLLFSLIAMTTDIVEDLENRSALTGEQKFEKVAARLEKLLRTETDNIPGWAMLHPRRRAKIVGGLIELVVFLVDIRDGKLDISDTRPARSEKLGPDPVSSRLGVR